MSDPDGDSVLSSFVPVPGSPAGGQRDGGPKVTRYEQSWDRYSREWRLAHGDAGHLGDEWGTQALTDHLVARYLAPYFDARSTVLEVGPGGGKYATRVAPRCARLICADVSQEMLDRTRQRLGDARNVELLKVDGLDLAAIPDASVDFAFAVDVFMHLDPEDVYAYLRELGRILRPGRAATLHFANLLTYEGWNQFVREADYNRAQFKQIGRISFLTPEIAHQMAVRVGFGVERLETSESDRDFLLVLRKGERPADPGAPARESRIRERFGSGRIERDLLAELDGTIRVAPADAYIGRASFEIDGDRRDVLFAHPPSLVGFPLTVPPGAVLDTAIAVHPEFATRCRADGIRFRIALATGNEEKELYARTLDPVHDPLDRRWMSVRVDLTPFARRVVFLRFETSVGAGPNEGNRCGFAEPAILVP